MQLTAISHQQINISIALSVNLQQMYKGPIFFITEHSQNNIRGQFKRAY